jgi:hypothetical protein
LTADTTGHHPTDDEAGDSVPMMWLANNLRDSRGENPKASVQPVLGARRDDAYAPPSRFAFLFGRWPPAVTPAPWACSDLHFRLPVTDCNAPGTAPMALTNAEKQARYRERHLENGTKTRGHFILEVTTKAKLLRLAHHRNCSVPALIGDLAASAERRVTAQLSGKALKRYYGEKYLP